MAIRPDYDVGELTLTSGSSDFTTSGSSLQTAAVQAGDAIIAPSGHVLIIASITGQNSGTLFLPCPAAAAGSGLPLRIRFQPDGSRYQGAVRVLIDLLSSGNLEAFAALVGAAGMVPIFTGPGTLDLADPATFGIQDPNGSLGKLAALTLAARQILQTDETGALTALTLAARQILQTDANGGLKAVALAANKLINTDDNGDILLSDITPFARTLLDDANGAAMWATMGASSNSNRLTLPDGRVFMMGTLAAPSTGYGPVTFHTSFPNNCFGVVSSLNANVSASYTRTITTFGHNQSGFSVVIQAILNGGTLQFDPGILFNYFAWGN